MQDELPKWLRDYTEAMRAKLRAAGHDLVRLRTADDVRRFFMERSEHE